jgi:hypothetical protein
MSASSDEAVVRRGRYDRLNEGPLSRFRTQVRTVFSVRHSSRSTTVNLMFAFRRSARKLQRPELGRIKPESYLISERLKFDAKTFTRKSYFEHPKFDGE